MNKCLIQRHYMTSLHLNEFVNIDVFRKGTYRIQIRLSSFHPSVKTRTFLIEETDTSPTTVGWKRSTVEVSDSDGFMSEPLNLEYRDQVFSLDQLLRFCTVMEYSPKNYSRLTEPLENLELTAKVSLFFNSEKQEVF